MKRMADISIRALRRGEEELGMRAIASLFRDTHILARNRDFFRWQFGTFNQGEELGFWIAETEKRIVGCIGGIAVDCHAHGRRFHGVSTINYALSPDYRRGGLAFQLLDVAGRGKMILGINVSAMNMQRYRKIRGMHIMDALPKYVCVVDREKLAGLLDAYGCGKTTIEEYDDVPDFALETGASGYDVGPFSVAALPEWDRCWNQFLAPALRGVVKDAAYMQWRYLDHPAFKYAVLSARDARRDMRGLAVVRKAVLPNGASVLRILEFLSASADAGAALAHGVGELVEDDDGIAYVEFLCLGEQWRPLSRIGVAPARTAKFSYYFAPPNLDFCDVSAGFFQNDPSGASAESFWAGKDAYLTIGDGDVDIPYLPR